MMSFNSFLKSLGRPSLGNPIVPTKDQIERLKNIEEKLGIERARGETIPEELEDGTEV
jgi:hypothetical protein